MREEKELVWRQNEFKFSLGGLGGRREVMAECPQGNREKAVRNESLTLWKEVRPKDKIVKWCEMLVNPSFFSGIPAPTLAQTCFFHDIWNTKVTSCLGSPPPVQFIGHTAITLLF